jgi:hypothetical protein
MPNQSEPGTGGEQPRRRIVRYKAMIKLRMERECFLQVFNASKFAGANSASEWMRKVLGEAASREIDRHQHRQRRPLGG